MKLEMLYTFNRSIVITIVSAFLIWSPSVQAHHKPGHVKGPKKGVISKTVRRKGKAPVSRGAPPPWAPAHGYRAKYRYKVTQESPIREFSPTRLIAVSSTGIGRCDRETLGAVLGAAAGGVAGSKLVDGENKILATIGGAIVGSLIGSTIGKAMDQIDQTCIGQILERVPTGSPIAWKDPDHGTNYNVTPTSTFKNSGGQDCREYLVSTVIGGKVENAKGTACRNPDGSWEKAN